MAVTVCSTERTDGVYLPISVLREAKERLGIVSPAPETPLVDEPVPLPVVTLQEVMEVLLEVRRGIELILGHGIPPMETTTPL